MVFDVRLDYFLHVYYPDYMVRFDCAVEKFFGKYYLYRDGVGLENGVRNADDLKRVWSGFWRIFWQKDRKFEVMRQEFKGLRSEENEYDDLAKGVDEFAD